PPVFKDPNFIRSGIGGATKKYLDISELPANYTDPQSKLMEEFSYISLRKATSRVP
uniref:Vps72/YL1 C-terminal domain-containing protein n=1 Tax=Callorhinchus milii TaxID=7868 RepID=A0A4W3IRQ1_CALMI